MRRIDAKSLRGLAHPLRMSILDAIELGGPATSTSLAHRLGENTGTISWHLRLLAEHGYLEEDTERGNKRERWWRIPKGSTTLDAAEFRDDPETRGAVRLYLSGLAERSFRHVRKYLDEDWPAEWQSAASLSSWRNLHLTPAQLQNLNDELSEVVNRYLTVDPAPDAGRVMVQLQSFPQRPEES
jgi:DNA-binding transcriptional ArsR family regulator